MIEWAEQELVIPDGPYRGLPYTTTRQPYARLFLRESGKWRRHNATGPSQSGKTLTCFVVPLLYHLFERRENVICGLPSLDMSANKWKQDIFPAIQASRYRELIPRRGKGSQGGTPTSIEFGNGATLMFLTGGGGDKQRAGATAPVVVITETDGMDEIGGTSRESDKISQLEVRTNAYQRVGTDRLYMECTVSTETGRTWREHIAGTESRIVCPCRHCGKWVTPEREDLHGWHGAETKLAAGRAAFFACPACGGAWTEADRNAMNNAARLLHRGQDIGDDGGVVGDAPETDTLSFRWTAFNNLFTTAQRLGEFEWEAARSEDQDTADLKMRQFFWTLPAKDESREKVEMSVGVVRGSDAKYAGRCSGIARGVVPDGAQYVTAFIDIGKAFLSWMVMAWTPSRSHVVDYGFHETSMPHVVGEEIAISTALSEVLSAISGRWALHAGLVDAGHWSDIVYGVLKQTGGCWMPSKGLGRSEQSGYRHPASAGSPGYSADKIPAPNGDQWYQSWQHDARIAAIDFHADWWKNRVHGSFLIQPLSNGTLQRGVVTLFGSDPNEHTELGKHLNSEVFVREFRKGLIGTTERWEKVSKNNHLFDCAVGCFVARSLAEAIANDGKSGSQRVVADAGDSRFDRFN